MPYPWETSTEEHIKTRQVVMQIAAPGGPRKDLPRRAPADPRLDNLRYGATIMTHFGASNGRLSVLLSSLPENLPVVVSSDAIGDDELRADREVAEYHGAIFSHSTPWNGRAGNAIHAMQCQDYNPVLFLNDDVWLYPSCPGDALGWYRKFKGAGMPIASLGVPGWPTYENWEKWGFSSWEECLARPDKYQDIPANPGYILGLHKNPFGACFVINREAYDDLGGFNPHYWAEDDVWNHQVWTSNRWLSCSYTGRGYMHLGAQSWHHGEAVEYVGTFQGATGLEAEESGRLQVLAIAKWQEKYGDLLRFLGGQ